VALNCGAVGRFKLFPRYQLSKNNQAVIWNQVCHQKEGGTPDRELAIMIFPIQFVAVTRCSEQGIACGQNQFAPLIGSKPTAGQGF